MNQEPVDIETQIAALNLLDHQGIPDVIRQHDLRLCGHSGILPRRLRLPIFRHVSAGLRNDTVPMACPEQPERGNPGRCTLLGQEISHLYQIVTSTTLAVVATDYRHSLRSGFKSGWTLQTGGRP